MLKEFSMPQEWLSLLMDKNINITYPQLQEMSCGEVYDLLEVQSCLSLRADIIADVEKNQKEGS